jgi:hypothetical protein
MVNTELFTTSFSVFSTIFDQKIRTTIYGNESTVCGHCVKKIILFVNLKYRITDQGQENGWDEEDEKRFQ